MTSPSNKLWWDDCSVCRTPIDEKNPEAMYGVCGHSFHKSCLDTLENQGREVCPDPNCQTDLRGRDVEVRVDRILNETDSSLIAVANSIITTEKGLSRSLTYAYAENREALRNVAEKLKEKMENKKFGETFEDCLKLYADRFFGKLKDSGINRRSTAPLPKKSDHESKRFGMRKKLIDQGVANISRKLQPDENRGKILDKCLDYINRKPTDCLPNKFLIRVTEEVVEKMFVETDNELLKKLSDKDLFEKVDRIVWEKTEKLKCKNETGEKPVGYDRPLSSVSTVSRKPSSVESQEMFNREIIKSGEGFQTPVEAKKGAVRKTEYVLNMDEDLIKTLGRCHDYINRQPIDRLPKELFVRVTEEITEKMFGEGNKDRERLKDLSDKDLFEKLDRIMGEKPEKLERKVGYDGPSSEPTGSRERPFAPFQEAVDKGSADAEGKEGGDEPKKGLEKLSKGKMIANQKGEKPVERSPGSVEIW
ncbi:MAG: RING-H2 finger protein [Chlamydiota bacterium]